MIQLFHAYVGIFVDDTFLLLLWLCFPFNEVNHITERKSCFRVTFAPSYLVPLSMCYLFGTNIVRLSHSYTVILRELRFKCSFVYNVRMYIYDACIYIQLFIHMFCMLAQWRFKTKQRLVIFSCEIILLSETVRKNLTRLGDWWNAA